jgi:anti-sigma regulatory factor (Ser/Thr protein kinase)
MPRVAARFPARPEGLAELHAAFERFFAQAERGGGAILGDDKVAILTASAEIAANIVRHACRSRPEAMVDLVLERSAGAVQVTFEDPGEPYVPRAEAAAEALPQRGMGLGVARASLDEFEYSRHGERNQWRLVRKTRPEA